MKIKRENTKVWEMFSFKAGEVFEYLGDLWIKTDETGIGIVLCVRLSDGHLDSLNESEFGYKCEAKVVVEPLRIQELEQKLKDMTANHDWWREQCKEFYKDYKTLAENFKGCFQHRG